MVISPSDFDAQDGERSSGDPSSSHLSDMTNGPGLLDMKTLDTGRRYTVIKRAGSGAFGEVYIADWQSPLPSGTVVPAMQHSYTRPAYVGKRIVAIKRCRLPTDMTKGNVRLNELRALRSIPAHPNTIALYDVFREHDLLHIVFECMEGNLYQLIKSRKGLPMAPGLVASVAQQMFRGIEHVHSHGFFHRDMKPENVLITTLGLGEYPIPGINSTRQDVLVLAKVADFGLARSLTSKAPYSGYISTRWYRAPEVLLRSPSYSTPIDVWALAAITAEMVMLEPLFPGANELDQLACIVRLLGTPGDAPQPPWQRKSSHYGGGPWKEAEALAERLQIRLPQGPGVPFETLFVSSSYPMLMDLLFMMLRYDPNARYTMTQCLQHSFFTVEMAPLQPIRCMLPTKGSAGQLPAEPVAVPSPPDHESPALSMESDERFPKVVDDFSLSPSEDSPGEQFATLSSNSHKSAENDDTTSTSHKFSDSLHSLSFRMNFMNIQKLQSRTSSPILWGRHHRQGSSSLSTPEELSDHKKDSISSESNSGHISPVKSASPSQSRSLPLPGSLLSTSKARKDPAILDAKQAERRRREEETRVMRARSRAVMQKREALLLSNYGSINDKGTRTSGWSI